LHTVFVSKERKKEINQTNNYRVGFVYITLHALPQHPGSSAYVHAMWCCLLVPPIELLDGLNNDVGHPLPPEYASVWMGQFPALLMDWRVHLSVPNHRNTARICPMLRLLVLPGGATTTACTQRTHSPAAGTVSPSPPPAFGSGRFLQVAAHSNGGVGAIHLSPLGGLGGNPHPGAGSVFRPSFWMQ
jgi:hypothetical protein